MIRGGHSYWETNEDDELECYLYEIRKGLVDGLKMDDIGKLFPLPVDSGFAQKKARDKKLYRHLKQAGYEALKVGDKFKYCPREQLTSTALWDICDRRRAHVSGTLRNLIELIASTPVQPSGFTKTQKEILQFKQHLLEYTKWTLQKQIDYIAKVSDWLKSREEGSSEE